MRPVGERPVPDGRGDPGGGATLLGRLFEVDDAGARVAKAKQLAGGVVVEPLDSSYGRYAVLRDDQGASFAIIKSATQPPQ